MKLFLSAVWLFCITAFQFTYSQAPTIDRVAFFNDTSVLNATLLTNLGKVFSAHKRGVDFPGVFVTTLPDGTKVNDPILIEKRGHFRGDFCYVPPVKLIFNYQKSSVFYSLKSLKLVSECKVSDDHDQFLLKEFIIYKIYNLLTDRSFRVRLLNLNWQDSAGKKKTITEHAFLLEDIKDVAKRNNCIEWKKGNLVTEATDRRQMTMVAIFEYMIGNTDWAVPVNHNIRLIVTTKDSIARPFAVPYDFDFSGFVNTYYSAPDERLAIESVRQRLYRGYPRSLPEIETVLDSFRTQKKNIYSLINQFDLLNAKSKKEIIDYLDEFYKVINDPNMIKSTFIRNARTE
jgi:hypothetical protein